MSVSKVRHRVGIDLDGDGYITWGVDPSLTSFDHLLPGAPDFLGMVGQRYVGAVPTAGATQQRTTSGGVLFPNFTDFWSTKVAVVNSGDQFRVGRAAADPVNLIANQFYIPGTDTNTVYFQCWVRCGGATSGQYTVSMQRHLTRDPASAANTTAVATQTLPSGTWVNLRGSFTNSATRRNFQLVFGFSATLTNFEVVGVRLNYTANNFHFVPSAGTAGGAGYEDVTDRVARLEYMVGTEDTFDRIPSDSTCKIVLNDPDNIYNPTYHSTPGKWLKRNKVVIEKSNDVNSQWSSAWQGYITNITPISGEARNLQVEIEATKTLFEVTNDEVQSDASESYRSGISFPYTSMNFSDALNDLFKNNSVSGINANPSWHLGVGRLDVSTVLVDGDEGIEIDTNTAQVRAWGFLTEGRSFLETLQGFMDMSPTTRFKLFPNGLIQITKPDPALPAAHSGLTFPDDYVQLDRLAEDVTFEYGKNVYTQVTAMHQAILRGNALLLPELKEPTEDVDDDSPAYTDRYWGKKHNIGIGERKRFRKALKTIAFIDPLTVTQNYEDWGLGNPPTGSTSYPYDTKKIFIESVHNPGFDAADPDKATHSIVYDATTPAGLNPGTRMTGAVWEANFRDADKTLLRLRFSNDGSHLATWSVDLQTVKATVNVISDPVLVADDENIDQLPSLSTYHIPFMPASFDDIENILGLWLSLYSLPQGVVTSFSFTMSDWMDESDKRWELWEGAIPGSVLYLHSDRLYRNDATKTRYSKHHSLGHIVTGKRINVTGAETKVTLYTTSNNSSGFE